MQNEKLAEELSKEQAQSKTKDKKVNELKNEIEKLKANSSKYTAPSINLNDTFMKNRVIVTPDFRSEAIKKSLKDIDSFNSLHRQAFENAIQNIEINKLANTKGLLNSLRFGKDGGIVQNDSKDTDKKDKD